MRLRQLAPSERPRERLLRHGAAELSDAELLALLLRTGKRGENALELARKILATNGNRLNRLAARTAGELKRTDGVKLAKATVMAAAFELGRRATRTYSEPDRIKDPDDVAKILHDLRSAETERFVTLCLSPRGQVLRRTDVGVGSLTQLALAAREVFRPAIEENAAAVIVAHNHPRGDARPSPEDLETTRKLAKAGKLLSIELLDHVVIGERGHFSIAEAAPHLFK